MNGLAFWSYLDLTELTSLVIGQVAAGSSDDSVIRVANVDTQYTAIDITVTVLSPDQLWLSLDGDTFSHEITVGDLPPGAASAPFWVRRVTPADADIGPATETLRAVPTAWTRPDAAIQPADPIEE